MIRKNKRIKTKCNHSIYILHVKVNSSYEIIMMQILIIDLTNNCDTGRMKRGSRSSDYKELNPHLPLQEINE